MSLRSTLDGMRRDNAYSNDIGWLQRRWSWLPVFVYGTTMKHYSSGDAMQGFPRVGIGHLIRPRWVMYVCDNEPVIFDDPANAHSAEVKGELFVVPPEMIFALDSLFCRGIHFYRRMEDVRYFQPEDLHIGKQTPTYTTRAFVFVGIDQNWQEAVQSGKALRAERMVTSDDGYYYRFGMQDDRPNHAHTHAM